MARVSVMWKLAVGQARLLAPLDLVRSVGLRYALVRREQIRRWDALRPTPRTAVYRQIWEEAAAELGAKVDELGGSVLELRRNNVATRVSHQWVALDATVALELAADKSLVHRLLAEEGLRVPEHLQFTADELEAAAAFFHEQDDACVVKPAHATGAGWGVVPAIIRRSQLKRAVLYAARYRRRLLIERQLEGDIYRLLLLDGVLVDAVRRRSPTVVGDGRSTIRELIIAENERRIEARGELGLWLLRIDLDCLFTLERAGLRLKSVPAAGERVTVKTATGENAPADNETVTATVPREVVSHAARAAAAVGLRLAGVDVITADARSGVATPVTILEVNGTPGLSHHRLVADRTAAAPVAALILEKVLFEASGAELSAPPRVERNGGAHVRRAPHTRSR